MAIGRRGAIDKREWERLTKTNGCLVESSLENWRCVAAILAIRSFGDALKCRFKEAVHILVEHARETMPEFPKEEKKPCLKKRKSSKRGPAFRKV